MSGITALRLTVFLCGRLVRYNMSSDALASNPYSRMLYSIPFSITTAVTCTSCDAHMTASLFFNLLACCACCRSTSVISRLNKSCVESIDTLTHTSPTLSAGTDGAASTALTEEKLGGLSSPSAVTLGSLTSAKPGEDLSGYLGLFSQQGKG